MKKFIEQQSRWMVAMLMSAWIGCNHHEVGDTEEEGKEAHASENMASYHEPEGLFLAEKLKKSIGLKIETVGSQALAAEIGITLQVFREAGERSSANQEYQKGLAYALASIPWDRVSGIHANLPVEIIVPSEPSRPLSGKIMGLDKTFKPSEGPTEALVSIPDSDNHLALGTFLSGKIILEAPVAHTAVPRSAILKTTQGNFVYVMHEKYLRRAPVETGSWDGEYVEIKQGLDAGEKVATQPVETLWLTELKARQEAEK